MEPIKEHQKKRGGLLFKLNEFEYICNEFNQFPFHSTVGGALDVQPGRGGRALARPDIYLIFTFIVSIVLSLCIGISH